jgi:3-oxoacyl-[acyl-carrier protein] reductase
MDLQLSDKVVLVTGAGQGLGRAIGLAFGAEGAHVAFHYHASGAGADAAAIEAGGLGVKAMAVRADLRSDDDVTAAVERVERELGPIDVLVNNAAATQRKPFLESTPEDWTPQVDVTVTGTLRVTHAVARRMAERRRGSIVNLMGDSGRIGESGLLVTATARAATVGLTKSLAKELGATGSARTASRWPSCRPTTSRRRPVILLLASPRSSWTTGQVISVNGGYAMI